MKSKYSQFRNSNIMSPSQKRIESLGLANCCRSTSVLTAPCQRDRFNLHRLDLNGQKIALVFLYIFLTYVILIGRKYLANSPILIPALESALYTESELACREHLLAALQKLSLRRAVQSQMISGGKIMTWLVQSLSDYDRQGF